MNCLLLIAGVSLAIVSVESRLKYHGRYSGYPWNYGRYQSYGFGSGGSYDYDYDGVSGSSFSSAGSSGFGSPGLSFSGFGGGFGDDDFSSLGGRSASGPYLSSSSFYPKGGYRYRHSSYKGYDDGDFTSGFGSGAGLSDSLSLGAAGSFGSSFGSVSSGFPYSGRHYDYKSSHHTHYPHRRGSAGFGSDNVGPLSSLSDFTDEVSSLPVSSGGSSSFHSVSHYDRYPYPKGYPKYDRPHLHRGPRFLGSGLDSGALSGDFDDFPGPFSSDSSSFSSVSSPASLSLGGRSFGKFDRTYSSRPYPFVSSDSSLGVSGGGFDDYFGRGGGGYFGQKYDDYSKYGANLGGGALVGGSRLLGAGLSSGRFDDDFGGVGGSGGVGGGVGGSGGFGRGVGGSGGFGGGVGGSGVVVGDHLGPKYGEYSKYGPNLGGGALVGGSRRLGAGLSSGRFDDDFGGVGGSGGVGGGVGGSGGFGGGVGDSGGFGGGVGGSGVVVGDHLGPKYGEYSKYGPNLGGGALVGGSRRLGAGLSSGRFDDDFGPVAVTSSLSGSGGVSSGFSTTSSRLYPGGYPKTLPGKYPKSYPKQVLF